jgi:integrase
MTTHQDPPVLHLGRGVSTIPGARGATPEGSRSRADVTLEEYAREWLANLSGRRPRTIEKYTSSFLLHILPCLGTKRLRDIGPDDLVALSKELRAKGYSEWTVDTTLTPLKTLFRHAVRRDVVPGSPFHKLERSERPRPWPTDQQILSSAQIDRLLAAAPRGYRLLIAAAIFTGLRQSELLALRWEHIDSAGGVVRVRTALDRNRKHVPLKTMAARRDVILLPSLAKDLIEAREQSLFAEDTDYVFASSVGTPLIWRNCSPRGLGPAARKAGVPRMRWHDLRHTFASILIANGANVLFVSRQLGHCSPDTTLQVYGHLWEGAEQAERTRQTLDGFYKPCTQAADHRASRVPVEPIHSEEDSELAADAPPLPTSAWAGTERVPYRLTIAATKVLLERQPERRWHNREVLEALLKLDFRTNRATVSAALWDLVERGMIERRWRDREVLEPPLDLEFRADRAAVNVALWDLAKNGLIQRVQRGLYTGLPPTPVT